MKKAKRRHKAHVYRGGVIKCPSGLRAAHPSEGRRKKGHDWRGEVGKQRLRGEEKHLEGKVRKKKEIESVELVLEEGSLNTKGEDDKKSYFQAKYGAKRGEWGETCSRIDADLPSK